MTANMPPPNGVRVLTGDTFALNYFANAAPSELRCTIRVLYDDGTPDFFVIDITNFTTNRSAVTNFVGLNNTSTAGNLQQCFKNGYVASVDLQRLGANKVAQRGQFYTSVVVGAGVGPATAGFEVAVLTQGYFFEGHDLRLGTYIEAGPAGGQGMNKLVSLGSPGAGTDFGDFQLATGQGVIVRGFAGRLVTGAGVANREFSIRFSADGTNISSGGVSAENQAASLTNDYFGGNGETASGVSGSLAGGFISVGIPTCFLHGPGSALPLIRFVTSNIQAADQWSLGFLQLEEWVMPN